FLNNTGRRVVIAYARVATDCLRGSADADVYNDRWWPKGAVDPCGTVSTGFTLSAVNPGAHWLTFTGAYADNGTTARVLWDGATHASRTNYGGDTVVTVSPAPLPHQVTF